MYKTCNKCNIVKLKTDFSNQECAFDGLQRFCKQCNSEYRKINKTKIAAAKKNCYIKNIDHVKKRASNYYELNKSEILRYAKQYRDSNKIAVSLCKKKCYAENPELYSSIKARRRAAKLQALPKWLTKEQLEQIKELYTCAQMFKLYTGQEYHVDHIVPLQGENVCGLHVPWNLQVIPAKENLSKSNKLQEDRI